MFNFADFFAVGLSFCLLGVFEDFSKDLEVVSSDGGFAAADFRLGLPNKDSGGCHPRFSRVYLIDECDSCKSDE